MDKMYTLQPNESINDHVKDSVSIITRIINASKEAWKYIPEKDAHVDAGTFVDLEYRTLMTGFEHIRESIQMLDGLCDELDRLGECVRHIHEIENHYMSEIQQLEERLKVEHEKYMKLREAKEHSPAYWKDQFERMCKKSNQLEDQVTALKGERDLAKKLAKKLIDEKRILKEELRQTQFVKDAQKKIIDGKEKYISDLRHEIWELQEQAEYWEDIAKKYADPDGHKPNNPANFCGNCKYFKIHPNDVGMCENIYGHYSKVVDPDDASCQAFESNKPNVVIDKPEFPCCEHCSHEDCDDCTLCPF